MRHPTDRQIRVLQIFAEGGATYDVVGRRLGIKRGTVKSHVSAIYRNLGVHTRSEAIAVALRHGYLR